MTDNELILKRIREVAQALHLTESEVIDRVYHWAAHELDLTVQQLTHQQHLDMSNQLKKGE